jgi:hypothetical protein
MAWETPQWVLLGLALVCFAFWAVIYGFFKKPGENQKNVAEVSMIIGWVLIAITLITSHNTGVQNNAVNQLNAQGFEVISLRFGSENKPGSATVKYHNCIGTFEFDQIDSGFYQVGARDANGGFVELTNIAKPNWTSCPQPSTQPATGPS